MKDALERIGADLAATIARHFESPEVRSLIEQTKAAPEADTGTFEVVITTANLDRYQEVISLDGWELDHYLANPVVLWGHDHNRIIGAATSLEKRDGKLVAKGKFAPTEEGQEKRRLYDSGFLRVTSVGFIEKEREGNLITRAELLEFSFVSVPANPYALTLAMERGLSADDLVRKGFMTVEKAAEEETVPDTVPESEEREEETTTVPEPETPEQSHERAFGTRQLTPVIDRLKGAIVALEALGSEEPEGDEGPAGETEEERGYREFADKRRIIQDASTVLGDVLAEARQAIEARKRA